MGVAHGSAEQQEVVKNHGFVGSLGFAVAAWAMPAGVDALHGESVTARALDAAQQFGRING
ncbi:hypothetical protein NBRC111894_1840 [Sporolactobacillus inulinus]|uniref:Uncharacterized protein n=1 Tax=Sporolactobacillus inulinus TaxID=2078 RepID=A0A4Y1ZB32_9BACL|nr:hypothetical protein NBRC111894_1840 [Sporolactobacillus inulinus]